MRLRNYLRIIIIIIIIGGVIIIIIAPPFPKPDCLVCGNGLIKLIGISQIILGAIGLGIENKISNSNNLR